MTRLGIALGLLCACVACTEAPTATTLPKGLAYIPTTDRAICAVTRVVDGDTITVHCGTSAGNVRLMGFDTPETFRPGCAAERRLGETAKAALKRALEQADVIRVEAQGRDKYNRTLSRMWLDGEPLASIMVSQGLAVRYDGGKRINWCERLT